MTTGLSGQSNPIIGIYPDDHVPPSPSTNFNWTEAPTTGSGYGTPPDEYALLKFGFTKPLTSRHTLTEAGWETTEYKLMRCTGVIGQVVTIVYTSSDPTPTVYTWLVTLVAGIDPLLGYRVATINNSNFVSAEPTPAYPADYSALLAANMVATSPLGDLAGFKLYMSTSPQAIGSLGAEIYEYMYSDTPGEGEVSKIITATATTVTFQYAAENRTFDSKEMYFAITHIDDEFPTANESAPDLGVYGTTLPGQAHLDGWTLDLSNPADPFVKLIVDDITTGGYNPHLDELMGALDYSTRGGYDIFRKELTQLDFTDGYYEPLDDNSATIVDTQLLAGSVVMVINSAMRQAWQVSCETNGEVDISDAYLVSGSRTGINYNNYTTEEFYLYQGTINILTDSIIPLTSDPTPVKQYLTDKNGYFIDDVIVAGTNYGYTITSVDTEMDYGKS